MKHLLSVAVVGIAALLPLTSHAQMRGMGGRGSAGFSRSSSGFRSSSSGFRSSGFRSSGFRSSGTVRTFAPSRTVAVRTFAPRNRVFIGGRTVAFRSFPNRRFFGRGCFGCRFPFFGTGFALGFGLGYGPYYPYYPYPYYSSDYYNGDYYNQSPPPASYNSDNNGQLANEVHRLSDEVEDLRSEENRSRNDARSEDRSSSSMSAPEPAASATFVFHDGRRIGAQNYAITGETLWIFNEHSARKFPLADLDVAATEKANGANGIEFHLPEHKH